ncbi:beta-lactamase hydrolase domain-containing protein [Nitrosomonas sp. ANs5]|uniref:beta-lactamase hydrolase domain-containing protein n=1 Tax=Nitrosomonas sp. ANs5 TaxID=3423941 RepID=UPI003D337474
MITLRHSAIMLLMLLTSAANAKDQVPYATQVNDLMRYQRVTPKIATSGALSNDSIKELVKHSFRTVIDLRPEPDETQKEKLAVEAENMLYINIPVTREGIDESQLTAFKQAIAQASPPILVHCATGNKAGAMWTSYRLSEGTPPNIAFKEGRASGMNLGFEEKVKQKWCTGQVTC